MTWGAAFAERLNSLITATLMGVGFGLGFKLFEAGFGFIKLVVQ